jgi:hypothetical protein
MPLPTRPDFYVYTDPNSPPQRIQVVQDGDELCARFVDEFEGPCLVPVKDMAGEFELG